MERSAQALDGKGWLGEESLHPDLGFGFFLSGAAANSEVAVEVLEDLGVAEGGDEFGAGSQRTVGVTVVGGRWQPEAEIGSTVARTNRRKPMGNGPGSNPEDNGSLKITLRLGLWRP
jgi:hypothetical protein